MAADRPDRDGSWRPVTLVTDVTVRDGLSVFDGLRRYSWRCNGVRGNVGGSSQSGRIVTTRHTGDGWWRFVTVSQFSMDLENIHGGVMVCEEMSADRPDRDGSWRPVTLVTDGDGCDGCVTVVSSCDLLRKYSWRCNGVWGNVGGSSRSGPGSWRPMSHCWRMVTVRDGLSCFRLTWKIFMAV